ncbi:MAG: class I SAM-dependent methyltransferase [Parcubacteria group bacterium]|jgi:ubiquinone/menaquinone biosynthesis C-methylase UbiE
MKTLFEGTSEYYAQYRPSYPDKMFSDIVDKFHLDGRGRLLDIGCGPGVLTVPLSKYFEEVIAVDIDSGMIKKGKRMAKEAGIQNIKWINKSADDLDDTIGSFKLITFGASFHWINREKFANLANIILLDDGGIVVAWTGYSIWKKQRNIWKNKVLEIIKKYLGEERRAGNGLYTEPPGKHEDILKKAGFKNIEYLKYPSAVQIISSQDIIKQQYTTSYAAKKLFGNKAANFEKELIQELLKINPEDKFKETHVSGAIFARKN